jgi:hypothetical protein
MIYEMLDTKKFLQDNGYIVLPYKDYEYLLNHSKDIDVIYFPDTKPGKPQFRKAKYNGIRIRYEKDYNVSDRTNVMERIKSVNVDKRN